MINKFCIYFFLVLLFHEKSLCQLRDIDGNIYKTVKIGNQIWMAENLRVKRFKNGDKIEQKKVQSEWEGFESAWCYYDNNPSNSNVYGLLYNGACVQDKRGIAPEGWHIATKSDWELLIKEAKVYMTPQYMLRSRNLWKGDRSGGDFADINIVPSGYRKINKSGQVIANYFVSKNEIAPIWIQGSNSIILESIAISPDFVKFIEMHMMYGMGIRCVKD
jgi:uncharacterized protein (TIGR02145 family)